MTKKVLIPTKLDKVAADLLQAEGYNVLQDTEKSLDELAKSNPDTNVIIVRSEKVTPEIIDALPELNLVVRAGAGYNTIDTKHARQKKVDVMNTPGANSNAVAEEVIALYLAAYRKLIPGDTSTRKGLWEKKKLMGKEITGKTIGIIGLGNIGRLVVKRLQGFDMKFMAYDPFVSADMAEKIDVQLASMEEIFSKSDCISLHIPENEKTKGIINKSLLGLMKPNSVLINCARAGIINESDLKQTKTEKGILYCNDVYPKDEAGEKSIADIADIMLPHLGASTFEANFNAAKRSAEQTMDYFEKGITKYVVNKDLPDGLDENYQQLANIITVIGKTYLGKNIPLHQIETTFYGDLHQYSKWMLSPILKGICSNFKCEEVDSDPKKYLKKCGVTITNREPEASKKRYGASMTIDLYGGDKIINKVSIRGTITEGNLMISRINYFDKLYLDPSGNILFVEYSDKPGVIGKTTSILGKHGINICGIRSPQDVEKKNSLLTIKTETKISANIVEEIRKEVEIKNAFFITL